MADDLAAAWDVAVELPEEPLVATPATLRRGRRMARALLRSNASAEQVAIFIGVWAAVVAQRREQLAGDEMLIAELRERAGLPPPPRAHAREGL